jgi:hypothetical protein
VFESRVLRRIFGSKMDEVIGGWRKLHHEELHKFYSSPNIIRMMKSRRMTTVGNVACMGRKGMRVGFGEKAKKKGTTRKTYA